MVWCESEKIRCVKIQQYCHTVGTKSVAFAGKTAGGFALQMTRQVPSSLSKECMRISDEVRTLLYVLLTSDTNKKQ